MEVLVSESARQYIVDHGGTVFVRPHQHRCCTGALTVLDVTTSPPTDVADFQSFEADGVAVRFCGRAGGLPNQLTIELRGLFTPHPVAFWDGCAYKP